MTPCQLLNQSSTIQFELCKGSDSVAIAKAYRNKSGEYVDFNRSISYLQLEPLDHTSSSFPLNAPPLNLSIHLLLSIPFPNSTDNFHVLFTQNQTNIPNVYRPKSFVMPGEYSVDQLQVLEAPPNDGESQRLHLLLHLCLDSELKLRLEDRLLVRAHVRWLRCIEGVSLCFKEVLTLMASV
jgi:hypothetical protein